jgi:hypothetical protein
MFTIVLVTVLIVLSNPLRKSPERIKETLLELTPIGIDIDDAIVILQEISLRDNWKVLDVNRTVGIDLSNLGFGRAEREAEIERLGLNSNMAGVQSVSVLFERYRSGIAWTSVHAY